ncbi:MAG: hypothetical protein QOG45_1215 [Chloroflexota bacterium]|nr:hypothetical protein [Chloroflexota bacterium]
MQALLRRFEDAERHPAGRSLPRRRRTRRRLAGVAGVTLIIATVMTLVVGRLESPAATADGQGIDLAGHIEAAHQTTLDFGGSGQVVAVNVRPGQAVEPGMVLASLDTAALEEARTQAGSALTGAQAKLSGDQEANPGAQAEAASLGVEDAAQSQLGAASSGLLDIQLLNESTVVGVQLGLVATRDIVAAAQAQVDAAKRNLDDTRAVDAAAVDGAGQTLDAVTPAALAAADTAQTQRDAASRAAQDAARVNQANVDAAQALVSADTAKLTADQATETTDCVTTPDPTLCAADKPIVSTDQQTLSKDQSALGQAIALARQSNDLARSALTAADVVLGNARSALSVARAVAQSAVDQQAAKGLQSDHLAQSVLDLARVALQAARDSTGPVSQNSLELARLRARQGIDQAQAQLLASQAALHSAQRAHAALHAPAAVQLILTDQSQVETAQAQAILAQHSLDSARLVAPVHGIVAEVNIVSGEQVGAVTLTGQVAGTGQSAGAAIATAPQGATATHAVVLQTPDAFQLSGAVRESDIVRVHVGDRVTVVATASPLTFTGKVTDIAPAGTLRGNAVTFAVTAAFEAPGTGLRSGMSARMRILVQGAGQPPVPDSTPAGRVSTPMSSPVPTATPEASAAATSPSTGG